MARLKTAKQRITDYLKALGKDASEIKDAFDELDAADVDLDKLAEYTATNEQWATWYKDTAMPAIQQIVSERDSYKERIAKLEAAGWKPADAQAAAAASMNEQRQPAPQNQFNPDEFQNKLVGATNTTIKNASKYSIQHFIDYKEALDIDAVEKIMGEKNLPFDVAYGMYTEPKRNEKREKDMLEKIQRGIQEGMQAERSKLGIRQTRKRTDDVDPAPLDKPAPSDADLKSAFLQDLNSETTH